MTRSQPGAGAGHGQEVLATFPGPAVVEEARAGLVGQRRGLQRVIAALGAHEMARLGGEHDLRAVARDRGRLVLSVGRDAWGAGGVAGRVHAGRVEIEQAGEAEVGLANEDVAARVERVERERYTTTPSRRPAPNPRSRRRRRRGC